MNKKRHKLQYTFQNVACNVISFEMLQCIESEKDFWPLLGGFCGWGWCNIVQCCTTLPPHLTQVFFGGEHQAQLLDIGNQNLANVHHP